MREILYKYQTAYVTQDSTLFGEDTCLRLTVEPHDFSLTLGGDTLRSTAFPGCVAVVSNAGAVTFYDASGAVIAAVDGGDATYPEVRFSWKEDKGAIQFGELEVIDHYPNCDGEHDRWSERWAARRTVTLCTADNTVTVG